MDDESGYRVEFSKVESFCYFWKNAWTSDAVRKPKVQILDTILLSNGSPHSWLFTSQQSGEIMKKKPEKLESVASIVDFMKKKSNVFKGYKTAELKPKIAIVWFVRTDKSLSSYLATEKELGSILSSALREVVAVQVYIGGFAMKGNGIFQHRVTRASNSSLVHQSYEHLDSLGDPPLSCFTNKCKKVIVLEQPMADKLRALGSALIRHIEFISSGEVEHLAFQVAFNSTWDPFLVAVRDVTLMKMPVLFYRDFDRHVFLDGIPPSFPLPHEQSGLLPVVSSSNALNAVSHDSYPTGTSADDNQAPPTLLLRGRSQRGLDIITEELAEASKVTLSNEETVTIPPPDFTHRANYFKSANEDYSLRKERPDLVFVAADDKAPLVNRTDSRHMAVSNHSLNHSQRATSVRPANSPPSPHSPKSHQTIGGTSTMIEEMMQHRNMLSASLSHNRPKSAALSASRSSSSFWSDKGQNKRYQTATAGYCHRTTYQGEDLQALPKPLHSFFKLRHPISAPHRADKKQRINTLRRSIDYVSGSFVDKEEEEDKGNDVIRRAVSFNSYDTVDTADTLGGAAFWRTLSHSNGKECFGDYCWFQEQCKVVYAEVRGERNVVVKNAVGEIYYTEHDGSRKAAKKAVSNLPVSAQVGFKSAACPFRLSLKSVLLARSENKVVGETLNTSVKSLVIRNKLANLEIGQIFAYFIRRHMNKVAERCQEDARKFRITSVPAVTSDWEDLNAVYRRTVYHDALAVVHPSRFYYSVPVCQCCYEIYLLLDELREETILHNPDLTYTRQSQSPTSSSKPIPRPRSANDAMSQQKLRRRLFRDIERSREDLLNDDADLMTSPSAMKQQRKVFINTDAVSAHSSDERKEVDNSKKSQRVRPASAHAVLTSASYSREGDRAEEVVRDAQTRAEKKSVSTSFAPSLVIRAEGDRLELVMTSEQKEEHDNNTSSPPSLMSAPDVTAVEASRKTAEAIGSIMQRMSPDFSFSSLPFYSSAPFLPIATEDPPVQTRTSSSSKKKSRLYRELSRSRSKENEDEVEEGRGNRSRGASFATTSPEEEGEDKGVRRINWDDIISRYERSEQGDVIEAGGTNKASSMTVEIPTPTVEGEEAGGKLSSESIFQLSPLDTSAEAVSFSQLESSLNISNSID